MSEEKTDRMEHVELAGASPQLADVPVESVADAVLDGQLVRSLDRREQHAAGHRVRDRDHRQADGRQQERDEALAERHAHLATAGRPRPRR